MGGMVSGVNLKLPRKHSRSLKHLKQQLNASSVSRNCYTSWRIDADHHQLHLGHLRNSFLSLLRRKTNRHHEAVKVGGVSLHLSEKNTAVIGHPPRIFPAQDVHDIYRRDLAARIASNRGREDFPEPEKVNQSNLQHSAERLAKLS